MEKQIVTEMKEKCLNTVEELKDEIAQNEVLIKSCDDAVNSLTDEKVTKKIKYNSIIAQNASLNPDVAGPEDKDNAEQNIKESTIQLMDSKKSLETVLENIASVDNANLIEDKGKLEAFVKENIESCNNWLDYSQKILNGEYDVINAEEKEEVEQLDEEVETLVDDEELGDKVVSVEPYEEDLDLESDINDISLEDLDKELDEAISDVHENIVDIKSDLDDIDSLDGDYVVPVDEPKETNLEDTLTSLNIPNEVQLEETSEEPLVVDNGIEEATNIDEGPVKVVAVEEIGAPEEVQEEEKGQSRRLAA